MRVGILTFHRALNYGAVLQCYALQKLLSDWGYEVSVIDYRQPYIEAKRKIFSIRQLFAMGGINAMIDYIKKRKERKKKIYKAISVFDEFLEKDLKTTEMCDDNSIPQDFDAYVIGSDQLWSENCLGGKFDNVYLAQFKHKKQAKIIGYAISVNRQSLENICILHPNIINDFNSISLREEFAVKQLGNLSHNIDLTIDPTLLLDSDYWDKITNDKFADKKYLLIYQVRGTNSVLYKKARTLADKFGLKIIGASKQNMPVQDFVSAIKYAQCVITTSFHATAFSIIFNKPFYAFRLNDGKDDRYVELTKKLGIIDHVLDIEDNPQELPMPLPEELRNVLKDYRKPSIQFLRNALNQDN